MEVLNICIAVLLIEYASASCGFPGAPGLSQVTFSEDVLLDGTYEVGTQAAYQCERGFELLGPSRRVCQSSGRWTPDGIPFCVLNVAAGKAPMQISTDDGGVPQLALDGSTSAAYTPETCTLTQPEPVTWWYVNLLEPYMVQLVRLDFGKACCGENKKAVVVVRVGNNRPDLANNPICNRFTGFIEEGQPLFLPCNPPMPGAFVSVHLEASNSSQLSICEAFVYTDQALPIERCPQFRDQPPGSTATYNGKCYIFYDQNPATFKEALEFCRDRGGTLVDESNTALQGFISWELWRRHRSDNTRQYWMGAVRDPKDRNNWVWVNGNDVTVSFWHAPGGKEHCARFDGSLDWLWADTDCYSKLNFICHHKPRTCGRPEQPPNSTMLVDGFDVGSTVQYACADGFLLVGPPVRTCLDNGFYEEFTPVCKRIECGFPAVIAHGGYRLLNDSVSYLSHVQYACNTGYEIVGRSRLVCDIDERWNGPPPRCEAVRCNNPPVIQGGSLRLVNDAITFGAAVEYSCAPGYVLRGAARAECLATGLWSQPPPACQPDEPETTTRTSTTETPRVTLAPGPSTPSLSFRRTSVQTSSPTPFLPAGNSRPTFAFDRVKPRLKTVTDKSTTKSQQPPVIVHDSLDSPSGNIIVQTQTTDKKISGSNDTDRLDQESRIITTNLDGKVSEPAGAHLNAGVVIAVIAFGALIVILAIISTVFLLIKITSRQSSNVSPPAGKGRVFARPGSGGSSETESQSGLTRFYRQNWEQLHEANNGVVGLQGRETTRDLFELVMNDAVPNKRSYAGYPRRHHHHHHRPAEPSRVVRL